VLFVAAQCDAFRQGNVSHLSLEACHGGGG